MSRSRSRPGCASGPLCYLPLRDPLFRVYLYLPRLTVPGLIWGPAARDAVIVTRVITRTRQVPETRYPYNRENIWFLHWRRRLIRELTNANIISEANYNFLVFAPYRMWRTKCEHGLGLPHNIASVFLTFLSMVLVRWRREHWVVASPIVSLFHLLKGMNHEDLLMMVIIIRYLLQLY